MLCLCVGVLDDGILMTANQGTSSSLSLSLFSLIFIFSFFSFLHLLHTAIYAKS